MLPKAGSNSLALGQTLEEYVSFGTTVGTLKGR